MKALAIFILFVSLLKPLCADTNVSDLLPADSNDISVFGGLIVWTAREAGADCWAEAIVSNPLSSSNTLEQVDFPWDPGFRVGLGYGMERSSWNTQFYYTQFCTRGKDSASKGPNTIHSTFLGNFYVDNPLGLGISGPAYESASIDWKIRYHIFDWDLGYNFFASKAVIFRPFVGVKGGWIHQSIHSKWRNPHLSGAAFFQVGTEDIKNNFHGIGPNMGVNSRWILLARARQALSIIGDFSGALMWGHWSFSDKYKNDLKQQITVDSHDINSGSSTFRALMGFKWDVGLRQNRNRLSTKLGYEIQFWLDQLQYYSFTGGRLNNVLTLQGGTLEFCFDF